MERRTQIAIWLELALTPFMPGQLTTKSSFQMSEMTTAFGHRAREWPRWVEVASCDARN